MHNMYRSGADLGGGCRGCAPPPPRDDLRFSNTNGILPKIYMWFIGVEVEQETSAPPPQKNPGSAPVDFLAKEEHLSVTTLLLFVTAFCFPQKDYVA